jgi:hypothetical protein
MQLDKTCIVIRERGWLDILDLALGMFRTHGRPILTALAAGAVPIALFNYWLLTAAFGTNLIAEEPGWYYFWQILLVMFEIPLATAPLTLYLGQLLFDDKPQPRFIAQNFGRSLPQLILFQQLLQFISVFAAPFLSEIILLERNPLRARKPGEISTRRRSAALHAGIGGEMFARRLGALLIGVLLTTALTLSLNFVRGVLGGHRQGDWWMQAVEFPLAYWLVVGFFAVSRFLGYLDVRIRREGWEVELSLRAEAARLAGQIT